MLRLPESPGEAFRLAVGRMAGSPFPHREGPVCIAREGIPIHVPDVSRPDAIDFRRSRLVGWRFLVYRGDVLVGAVVVREEGGHLRTAGIEVERPGGAGWATALDAAIPIAGEGEEAYELRMLEVPWLHAAFAWLSGPRSVFVSRGTAEPLDEEGFREALRRLGTGLPC